MPRPRINLASLPTPLQEMPRLTKKLNGPRLFVKRDDLTGLVMGGNKTRKLEFIMADARSKGADIIVTGAGLQSNWSTLATAAAENCNLQCRPRRRIQTRGIWRQYVTAENSWCRN